MLQQIRTGLIGKMVAIVAVLVHTVFEQGNLQGRCTIDEAYPGVARNAVTHPPDVR
jgi:hypothetical protein